MNKRLLLSLFFAAVLPLSSQIVGGGGGGGGGGATGATGPGYTATAATSLAVGAGSKTLTTQGGLAYAVGGCLFLVSRGTPASYMTGPITAYNSTTGSLTFTSTAASADVCSGIGTAGTLADWNLSVGGFVGATGTAGSAGATGFTGPTGTIGNLIQDSSNTALTCSSFANYENHQATASITYTLPTGCTVGWVTVTPGTGFTAAFNLSTNTVTANGQSTLTTIAAGTGTAGYGRVVLTPNPSLSTDFIATLSNPTGGTGTPGGSSGQIQYNNSGSFGGFTASGDVSVNTGTGAATLATVNANTGSCGDSTHVCVPTFDAKGRATAASAVAISGGTGGAAVNPACTFSTSATGCTITVSGLAVPSANSTSIITQCFTILAGTQTQLSLTYTFTTGSGIVQTVVPLFGAAASAGYCTANLTSGGVNSVGGQTGTVAGQGTGAKAQMSTGTTTTNDCAKFDATGNTVDSGGPCGGSSSEIITQSGTASATTNSTSEFNLLTGGVATAVKIPAGTLTANGSVSVYFLYQSTGATNTKFPIVRIATTSGATSGGFVVYNASMSTGQLSYSNVLTFYNSGATNTQVTNSATGSGNATLGAVTGAVDTAANDIYVNFNGLVTSPSDTIRVMAYKVVVNP